MVCFLCCSDWIINYYLDDLWLQRINPCFGSGTLFAQDVMVVLPWLIELFSGIVMGVFALHFVDYLD
jgi:hypothetical protein